MTTEGGRPPGTPEEPASIEGGRPPWTPEKPVTEESEPLFRVVKGAPTDEELAAIIAVLIGQLRAAPEPPARPAASGWSAYWRGVRAPLAPGPGSWRASGRS